MSDTAPPAIGQQLFEFCRSLAGATEDVKWGNDLVFSVGKKMFACFALPDGRRLSFKVDPIFFESLTTRPGVEPAPYLARHHWIQILDASQFPLDVLEDFLEASHGLVAAKLSRKLRRELGIEEAPARSP